MTAADLDSPERLHYLRDTLARKGSLRALYAEMYQRFGQTLDRSPIEGLALEVGSGGGFAREMIDGLYSSDVIRYSGLDVVMDAQRLPFADSSLRALLLLDVFHHIPDVEAFLREAERCLKPGGRILIIEPHLGFISRPVLRWVHHEPCEPDATSWSFSSAGPLSGANSALGWIVFHRDRELFEQKFPQLELATYEVHSPLRYWLSGGMRRWSLLPDWAFGAATRVDRALVSLSSSFASFANIELVKRDPLAGATESIA